MILGEGNVKMSKSLGNVINPDEIVETYGADTMRLYEMFMGDFEKAAPWSSSSIKGCKRFLDRTFNLQEKVIDGGIRPEFEGTVHKTIKKITEDIEGLKFNTAIAQLMTWLNDIEKWGSITKEEYKIFLLLLDPFAPHICEEIWEAQGFGDMIVNQQWPKYDEAKCVDETVEIAVQVTGKVRARINIPANATQEETIAAAKADAAIAALIEGKNIVKEIYVPGRLVNIVAK